MSQVNYQRITQIAIAIISSILILEAVSKMMFASLGQTTASKGWSYILTLQIVLAIIGVTGYLSNSNNLLSAIAIKINRLILTTLSGVLLGFYYGGTYTDNNSQAAVVSAIATGIIFNLLARKQRQITSIVTIVMASICAYGFALMRGVAAINLIAGSLLVPGIIWGCICLIYLGLTVSNLAIAWRKMKMIAV